MNNNNYVIVCQDINMDLQKWKNWNFVGVESGTIKLIRENYPIVFSCSDFDHVTLKSLNLIKQNISDLEILPCEKNILDSEYAIKKCISRGAKNIILLATGYRWGMTFALINLLIKYQKYNLVIYDEKNILMLIKSQKKFIKKDYKQYRYFDFLPLVDCKLKLQGFKYPLDSNYTLVDFDNYFISNELNSSEAIINVIKGYGILTISK